MFKRALPLFLLALGACSNEAPSEPKALPPLAPSLTTAETAAELVLAELSATVVQPPGARVAVATPLGGIVQTILVQPGQSVRRGQTLATVISRDALAIASDRARAQAQAQLTRAEAARMAALVREGVVAGARLESAEAAQVQAAVDVNEASRLLAGAGADRNGIIRLTAPIAGRVATVAVDVGAALDGASAPFVIEADGSRWLALQIPERLAAAARPGLRIVMRDGRQGRLETVATGLDPATRAFAARARLSDDGPSLTSGQLLRVALVAPAPRDAVTIPQTAIVREADGTTVFVKTGKGFASRSVRVAAGDGAMAVVTSGLRAGEQVAVTNLPELRAQAAQ